MNLAYLDGLAEGIGATALRAELDPAEGRCCVRLQSGEQILIRAER
jgi:hypothetical protein